MDSMLWEASNRTAETLLIINLFHLLLAGLVLLLLLRQARKRQPEEAPEHLLSLGFSLMFVHFGLLTLYFGASFFLRRQLQLEDTERLFHGLFIAAVLLVVAAYQQRAAGARPRWLIPALLAVGALVAADVALERQLLAGHPHSAFMLASDAMGVLAVIAGWRGVWRHRWEARGVHLAALGSLAVVLLLHGLPSFVPGRSGILLWNVDEHLLSFALVALAWAIGERSKNLLDRVFVRLNLTFIVLASLIMLATAGMEKYQYFRLTQERSMDLAEFLRGHLIYYQGRGQGLNEIFEHPEVMKRVVVEFSTMPELREIDVALRGEQARFLYTPQREIKLALAPLGPAGPTDRQLQNSFQIISLPVGSPQPLGRIEFIGTTDFVNERIGRYIIFIYSSFTVVLLLATALIGIIVADTDRRLRQQYEELQEAQQQLLHSAKLASIGELAGGVAHEINNPITSILALASHMAEKENAEALAPRSRKNLRLMVQQAERVANLVGGLLSFSRQTQLHIRPTEVEGLVNTALDLVQYRLKDGSVRVSCQIEPGLPPVAADPSRLTEVLVNLLKNALDAMPLGGTLTVRALACASEGTVRLEVQDTGEGIPLEQLPRIFDPFFTTKPPGAGTGLGLSIVHGIVKDHGGEVWAQSEPGAGTTIVVSLPAGANQYEAACAGD